MPRSWLTALALWSNPTTSDNSGGAVALTLTTGMQTITATRNGQSVTVFKLGDSTVAYQARDPSGNINTCSFKVTVQDTTKPTITCPNVNVDTLQAGRTVTYGVTASDNYADPSITHSRAASSTFAVGTTTSVCGCLVSCDDIL